MLGFIYRTLLRRLPKVLVLECLRGVSHCQSHDDLDPALDPLELFTAWHPAIWLRFSVQFFETNNPNILGWVQPSTPPKSGYRYCSDPKQRERLLKLHDLDTPYDFYTICASGSVWGVHHYLQIRPVTVDWRLLLPVVTSGNLQLLVCLARNHTNLSFNHHNLLHQAIAVGALDIVRYLRQVLELETEDFRASEEHRHLYWKSGSEIEINKDNWSIIQAITGGHFEMVRCLHQEIGLYPEDFREDGISSIVKIAGSTWELPTTTVQSMIRYLYSELDFGVLPGLAIGPDNLVLKEVCDWDNAELLKLLRTELGFTDEILRPRLNQWIADGSRDILNYLTETGFEVETSQIDLTILQQRLRHIFQENDLEMLRCLHRAFNLSAQDLYDLNLELKFEYRLQDMLEYLYREMKLTAIDFESIFKNLVEVVGWDVTVGCTWLRYLHQVVGVNLETFWKSRDYAIFQGNLKAIKYLHQYKPLQPLSSDQLDSLADEYNHDLIQFFRSLT